MSYNAAMSRRRPIRRIFKWTGLVLCVLIVVVWGLSLRWKVFYDGDGWWFGCGRGNLWTGICPVFKGKGWDLEVCADSLGDVKWGFRWPYHLSNPMEDIPITGVGIPLWLLFLIAAIPTTFLFWRDRRSIPPGYCQECGYDLTGNVSGRCPECGGHCNDNTSAT